MSLLPQGKKVLSLGLYIGLGLVVACANPGKSPDDAAPSSDAAEAPFGNRDAEASANGRGRVLVDFKFSERMRDVKGSIVGTGPAPTLTPILDQPGRFQFAPLKAGIYDFIIEGTRLAAEPSQANQPLALRISSVEVKGSGDIFLRDIELRPYIELSGEVRLLGQGPEAGIEVSIPGTPYKALSDENGRFKLSKIPEGHHQLLASFQNFSPALFERRQYTSSQELPALTIFNDRQLLPVGVHYEGEPLPAEGEATVTLFLQRPQGMNMLRWGFSQDLNAAAWVPYQSSQDFTFASGQRQIFVQFSRDRQQLSPVYPLQIPAP